MIWQLKRNSHQESLFKNVRVGNLTMTRRTLIQGVPVDVLDTHGRTALCLAAISNNAQMIRLLIEAGADININLPFNRTPIYHAIHYGSLDTVRLMVDLGARIDIKDQAGHTPYSYAKARYKSHVAEILRTGSEAE